jgi:lipopolysaccharide export LptBFGC system permease protein LptF
MLVKTLDKYIIRSFLHSFLMWLVVFLMLRVVVDLFTNMDEYGENLKYLSQFDNPVWLLVGHIAKHYAFQCLIYFTEMGGVIIVAAAAFTVARMNHTNELTAIMASGVSLRRVVLPIILFSVLFGGLIVVDQELVIPKFRNHVTDPDDLLQLETFQVRMVNDSNQSVWFASNYQPAKDTMQYPLVFCRDKNYRYTGHLYGRTASPHTLDAEPGWSFTAATLERAPEGQKGPWRHVQTSETVYTVVGPETMLAAAEKRYQKENDGEKPEKAILKILRIETPDEEFDMVIRADALIPSKVQQGVKTAAILEAPRFAFYAKGRKKPIAVVHADQARWVEGTPVQKRWVLTNGRLFAPSDLTPRELQLRQTTDSWMEYLSSAELAQLMEMGRVMNPQAAMMTRYNRFAGPLNNLIMLLVGLPFILSRERNIKASAMFCLLVVGAFYVFIYVARYMGLPEALASFLPVLIFGPISAVMLDSVKT